MTTPISGPIATFNSDRFGIPVNSLICDINPVQAGSGDPSPSNVRSIAGFTQVDLPCAGRNLLVDNRVYPFTYNQITTNRNADGSYQITGNKTNSSAVIFMPNFASASATGTSNQYDYKKWLPNGSYKGKLTAEGLPAGAVVNLQVYGYNSLASVPTMTLLGRGTDFSFSVTDAYPFIFCRLLFDTGAFSNLNAKLYPMIYRADESDTTWEPPRSSTNVSLGRTVYGGKLNVTTGELTVTHTLLEMDGSTTGHKFTGKSATSGINEYYIAALADAYKYNTTTGYVTLANLQAGGFYCSVAPVMGGDTSTNAYGTTVAMNSAGNPQPRIRFLTSDTIQDTTAANAWLASLYANGTPCVFCYKLATAQTYQLSATQITSLLGENNIWADCGDVEVIFDGKSIVDDLIFDRTQEDVDRVKEFKRRILNNGWTSLSLAEQTEYLAGMKGAYNAVDLNRIGQAINFIALNMESIMAMLEVRRQTRGVADDSQFDLPIDVATISEIEAKIDWTIPDIPIKPQTDQILADIATLRTGIPLPVDAPDLPANMDALDYLIANDIEYLLYAIDEAFNGLTEDIEGRIDRAANAWYYSSETNCGG